MKLLNSKFSLILIVVLIIMNGISLYFLTIHHRMIFGKETARPRHDHYERFDKRDPHPTRFLVRHLDLSEEQVEKLKSMREELHENTTNLRREVGQLRQDLFSFTSQNKDEVDSIIDLMSTKQEMLERTLHSHFSEVRNMCTDEQKIKYDKMIGKIISRFNPPHERHGKRGRKRRRRD